MEPVSAPDDVPNLRVEGLSAGVADVEPERSQDAFLVLPQGPAQLHERLEPASLASRDRPVDQLAGILFAEIALEDLPHRLLVRVGAPRHAAATPDPIELLCLACC